MIDPRRRRFLRGAFGAVREPVVAPPRPPWALAEPGFLQACTRCGDCVTACPRGLLAKGDGGYPVVSFAQRGCDFCGACERACAPKALARREGHAAWSWKAVVDGRCLAARRVECRICAEACDARAIRMVPEVGSVAQPRVDAAACTGCGECRPACPAGAIHMIEPAADAA